MKQNERDEREQKILKMRSEGATYQQIASACNLKYTQQVYQVLAKHELVCSNGAQKRKLTEQIKEQICSDRIRLKLTYVQLSLKYCCSTVSINKVLRAANLTGE